MMCKLWLNRTVAVTTILVITLTPISYLRAHEAHNGSAKDIEAHRKTDFGFDGFKKLNSQLQKDFQNFNYAANAAAYRRMMSLAFGGPTSYLTGEWSPVINLPVVAIHTSVLPNGKVLMWDSISDLPAEFVDGHTFTRAVVWDPVTGVITPDITFSVRDTPRCPTGSYLSRAAIAAGILTGWTPCTASTGLTTPGVFSVS